MADVISPICTCIAFASINAVLGHRNATFDYGVGGVFPLCRVVAHEEGTIWMKMYSRERHFLLLSLLEHFIGELEDCIERWLSRFLFIDVEKIITLSFRLPEVEKHLNLDFIHSKRVGVGHGILYKEFEMLQVAIVTELNVVYVALALGTWAFNTHFVPELSHLAETSFSDIEVKSLHQLVASEEMAVGALFRIDFIKHLMVLF